MDERTKYFRRLRRLRSSARRWTVFAGGFTGVAAVLVPYQGLGPADAIWAGLAGASAGFAWWRWSDARSLAAEPVPDPPDPALAADRWLGLLSQFPGGQAVAENLRRQRTRGALRGSGAAEVWERLDRASRTLQGLAPRLASAPEGTLAEAGQVERGLRALTTEIARLEQALRTAPADAKPPLESLREAHVVQLEQGVSVYEQFVVAAVGWLSESEQTGSPRALPAVDGLTDATDQLRGITGGLAELRDLDRQLRSAG